MTDDLEELEAASLEHAKDPCFRSTCELCHMMLCAVCEHRYGEHYDTHDGTYSGCATCAACEGFMLPEWLPGETD